MNPDLNTDEPKKDFDIRAIHKLNESIDMNRADRVIRVAKLIQDAGILPQYFNEVFRTACVNAGLQIEQW